MRTMFQMFVSWPERAITDLKMLIMKQTIRAVSPDYKNQVNIFRFDGVLKLTLSR